VSSYQGLIAPVAAQIAPSLKACASSSSWYIEASDGPSISTALTQIFGQASTGPRMTH